MTAKLKVPPRDELFRIIGPLIDREGLSAAKLLERTGFDISRARMGAYRAEYLALKALPWDLHPRDRDTELARYAPLLELPGRQPIEVSLIRNVLDETDSVLTYDYDAGFRPALRRAGEKYIRR